MKLGVLIERDGVLNRTRIERQHQVGPLTLEDFHIHKAVAPLLHKLKSAGFILLATTNQPGLSRGWLVVARRMKPADFSLWSSGATALWMWKSSSVSGPT